MNLIANESIFGSVTQINETLYTVCSAAPPNIVSDGLWGGQINGRVPMKSSFPLFELQMLVIFAVTQICQFFLKYLNFPLFISQMMAGLILGPSIQHETLDKYKKMLFPFGSQDTLATITSIGYALFHFTNAVQMDMSMITKTGRRAWSVAIIGFLAPLIVCFPIAEKMIPYLRDQIGEQAVDVPVVVVAHTGVKFAVIASLLNELKILNSGIGRLALSSALVTDILSIIMGIISTLIVKKAGPIEILVQVMPVIAFCIIVPLVCRPAMFWIIKNTPEGRPVADGYIYVIIIMVFALGWVAVQINQGFELAAFLLGLAVPEGPPLGSALVKKLQFFGTSLFLPIFVTCGVLKADFSLVYSSKSIMIIGFFIALTYLIKIIACVLPALYSKMPLKDALALGFIMSSKGVVEVGIFSSMYDEKVINGQTYGMMIIIIMIIGIIVKWSVKCLYDPSRKYAGYRKRNITSLKPDSELRILACVHKNFHINAIRDALDICCPTTEYPIIVDALHLIELIGRTSPIFISHRNQKNISDSQRSYSDDLILAFNLYEHDNIGAVTAHTYTAISPPTLMSEDVCQLALDKVASLIILPFHQRWSKDGGIESDDKNIRSLNCKVIEMAPCSVGILVSRSSFNSDSYIRLAMIFLGGKDDREALCLAKRAIRNTRINLVVYHLAIEDFLIDLDYIKDTHALEGISGLERVSYIKVMVNNGPETSAALRDIANEHDFFIVGRRHQSGLTQIKGLSDWSEFPELGVIGDVLASTDFQSRACVLVVQHQGKD
ncbi:cation/H(+) antiporter 4-like [Gastrolobium bilobum]|uniref:cation/H(+) antiporter 4-like n=1 Tax=Gastrolobium bilobum TaxID=150636 RepID=UPI002AB2CBC2|nr:cation/H(+) antiporter 4-like [Gastrolobium bilobum]